jgi:sulfide:quinone oxidoreductase
MAGSSHHQVVIVGGGSAGITVAAILKRRAPGVDVALIEPGRDHYYQPAFTLVGAGAYPLARTHRTVESLIPFGVRLIRAAAQAYEPQTNMVRLNNGDTMTYDYLVVCTGVALDWGKVAGLTETLGKNGVCSNYSPAHVTYTWDACKSLNRVVVRCSLSRRRRSSARALRRRLPIWSPTISNVRASRTAA